MGPLECLRNALARTREHLAGKRRTLGLCSLLLTALLSVLLSPGTPLAVVATQPPAPVLQLGGTDAGYFGRTFGVALDTSGNIYVADHENRRIQKFDAQGNFLSQFPVATDPFALTIANGTVYVAGENGGGDTNSLLKYDLLGNFLRGFGGSGVAFVNVAVDPAGNVYVVEASHGNVLKFAPDGTRLSNAFGGHSGNEAVATDGNYIYITSCVPGDTTYPLQKYDFTEHLIDQWGTASQFNCAGGLAIDSIGDVHIADTNRHRILTFTNNGTLLDQTGSLGQGNGQFYYPWELATDAAGHTYVADTENSRVQIFDSTLNFVVALGKSSLYGIYNNVGVSSTPDGHIYVADTLPPFGDETRLSVFDSQGNLTFRRNFADVLPSTYSTLNYPTSVAVAADGGIYVEFGGGGCTYGYGSPIFKFDSQLTFVTAANSLGCPGGLTIDALGLVYAVGSSTVNIYDGNLNQAGTFPVLGTSGHGINLAGSIAADSQGVIYVTTGDDVGIYDGPGNQLGFFPLPGSILATAPDRSLFVGDPKNDTLSVYPPASTTAQLVWNLPYFPNNVHVDQSKVYVVGGGCGALVCAVNVFVYSSPMFVSGVTPPIGGDTGGVTVTIKGRGFQQGAVMVLRRTGQPDIVADTVSVAMDGTSASVHFDLTGQANGAWDVVVTNPDGFATTLPGGFTIEPGGAPLVWVDIVGRQVIGVGRPETYTFLVGNLGNVDVPGALIVSGIPPNATWQLDLPPPPVVEGTVIPWDQIPIQVVTDGEIVIPLPIISVPPGVAVAARLRLTLPVVVPPGTFQLRALWMEP